MSIKPSELVLFFDRALDGMIAATDQLGDDLVNQRPDLPGANSPYVIVTHCIGLTHWWVGMMGAGRDVVRDRNAEFEASGNVAELAAGVRELKAQLRVDIAAIDAQAPIRQPDLLPEESPQRQWNRGEALIHAYEELAQHHGHLELTRDILLAG